MTDGPRVAFRTSGGREIGLGHVRRCLSLALALRKRGTHCLFLVEGDPEACELVAAEGFAVMRVRHEDDAGEAVRQCKAHRTGIIVVDSYAFATSYFLELCEAGLMVAVVDDLADRELPVHLVVNGSAGADRLRYRGGAQTRFLLGPQYMLVRPEFAVVPVRAITDRIERVLITVGGSDPHGLTARLMRWTSDVLGPIAQDVVIGPLFENAEAVQQTAQASPETILLHENPKDMRTLMLRADLALCGGGQTSYELAATGTPSIAVRTADNQTVNLKGLSGSGILVWAGDANDADLESKIAHELKSLAGDAFRRNAMSRKARALVDGQGAGRVAQALEGLVGTPAV